MSNISVITGVETDLISPFPLQELHRIYRWKHCYRSLSNSDFIPQGEKEFLQYLTDLLPAFSSWGIIDKHQITTQKHEAPIVGCVFLQQTGVQITLHFASSRTAFKQGLLDDAVRTIVKSVFEIPGILRVACLLDDKNPAIKGLLRRCGFRMEGVVRDAELWKGEEQDLVWFALTRRNWVEMQPQTEVDPEPVVASDVPSASVTEVDTSEEAALQPPAEEYEEIGDLYESV